MKNENKKIFVVIGIILIGIYMIGQEKKEYYGECTVEGSYSCASETMRAKCGDWDSDGDFEWKIWSSCMHGDEQWICEDGYCVDPTLICTDTDGGLDYYVKGTMFDGLNYFTDNCLAGTNILYEYYCEGNLPKYERYECPDLCSGDICTSSAVCLTDADTDCDGEVVDIELLVYASKWLQGSVSDIKLLEAASAWLN